MLFYLFCILSFVYFVPLIISIITQKEAPASILLCIVFLIPIMISIMDHTSDLAMVRSGQLLVSVQEQALKDIDEQLSKVKVSHTSLMNSDSPAKSLIEARKDIVISLADARTKIAKAKISIETRSIGLMSPVVKIYGRE